jgi:hypothetical protein
MHSKQRSLTIIPSNVFFIPEFSKRDANTNIFSIGLSENNTFGTIKTTNVFNNQFKDIMGRLTAQRNEIQQKVNIALERNPNDTSNRQAGVKLAREYEQAEIEMGGKGTRDRTKIQVEELKKHGSVRGEEGHHINNVKDHPEQQGNPDNIRFAGDRDEHKAMHGGDFRNKTEGDLIDRDKRLNDTNNRRVIKNELSGLGMAAAIGFGTGFSIGFIVTLAQSGISPENIRNAAVAGTKSGVETMSISLVNYGITRGIGEIASSTLQGFAKNLGFTVTENIITMCNMGVIGTISICVFSVYQFAKLKVMGYGTKECLLRVGKQAAFSFSVLAISIIAQGLWGGYAGLIVSISIGLIVVSYKVCLSIHDKQFLDELRFYTIEKTCPYFGGLNYELS